MSLQLIETCKSGNIDNVKKLLEANYSLIERDAVDKRKFCQLQMEFRH